MTGTNRNTEAMKTMATTGKVRVRSFPDGGVEYEVEFGVDGEDLESAALMDSLRSLIQAYRLEMGTLNLEVRHAGQKNQAAASGSLSQMEQEAGRSSKGVQRESLATQLGLGKVTDLEEDDEADICNGPIGLDNGEPLEEVSGAEESGAKEVGDGDSGVLR